MMLQRSARVLLVAMLAAVGMAGCDGAADRPSPTSATDPSVPQTMPATTQPATTAPTTQPSATQPAPDVDEADRVVDTSHPRLGDGAVADRWHEPDERPAFNFDFDFTDQNGEKVNLQTLKGKPIAMTFFFTRCPNPQMCPVIISNFAALEMRAEREGLGGRVQLVAITYDPHHDTPAVMKRYGEIRGVKFTQSVMLRPGTDRYRELLEEFEINIVPQPTGFVGHFIEMILFDAHGRYVRDYRGDIWSNDDVLADLKRLVEEHREETAAETEAPESV